MAKPKLFIDFDNTLVNSTAAICEVYNEEYKSHVGFVPADWRQSQLYDFSDICPLASPDVIEWMFAQDEFFENLWPLPYAREAIRKLKQDFELYIVSIGTPLNLSKKSYYISKVFPMIDNVILLGTKSCAADKSIVDMSDGCMIDDSLQALNSSNADVKIVFGPELKYNKTNQYMRLPSWGTIIGE